MEKLKIFMIMPFQEEFLKLYEMIKEKLGNDYEFSHAGDLDNQQNILQDIVVGIANAHVIIADVTGLNPNVFYELGLCHALNKKVILLTQAMSELPFDIRSYRANQYSTNFWEISEITSKIEEYLNKIKTGTLQFGNPITDYFPKDEEKQSDVLKTLELKDITSNDETGKGFLDLVADIEDEVNKLTDEMNIMKNDLEEMNSDINCGTAEINRISKLNGSGNATFVRNISRKIGESIYKFSTKMKTHNEIIEITWNQIENNYLDLIDNKYMDNEENKTGLKSALKELKKMQDVIKTSNVQVESMIKQFISAKGLERKLTQSIDTLDVQINKYLSIMESSISSIDRIISKSEIIIGKIEFEDAINEN